MIEKITKLFVLLTLIIPLFVKMDSLFYPFTSGKALFFRFFVFVAFLGWVILMLKDKRFRPKLNLLIIALVLFVVGMFITSFLGVDVWRSIFSNFERNDGTLQFSFFVLYFLILTSVFKTRKDWQILIGSFLLAGVILSVYSWTYYGILQSRLYGFFGNPAYFGAFLLIAIGFTIIMIRESFRSFGSLLGNKITKIILFLLLLSFIITLFYTGTRGCYAGLIAFFGLMVLLSILLLRRQNKKLVISLVSVVGVFVVLSVSIFAFADHPFVKSHPIISRINDLREFGELPSVKERLSVWEMALKGFKDRPVFGWGPENFGPIFNKYYDYNVGLSEPWFDKAHNQFLEVLATGGIFLFSFYLFWIFSVFYLIFKIFKKERILAIILTSVYFGYLVQGVFLFDTLPMYFFLFTLLGFISFEYQRIYKKEEKKEKKHLTFFSKCLIGGTALIVLTLIYTTAWLPYRANALGIDSYLAMKKGEFKEAKEFFEEALEHDTPFTFAFIRKKVAWEILPVFSSIELIQGDISPEQIKPSIKELYRVFTSELEKVKERHRYDPQIYFVLGTLYRLGGEYLQPEDLAKADKVFKESLNYSKLRTDYYNEYAKVLLAEGKYEEAKNLIKDYIERTGRKDPFVFLTLGNISFLQGDYREAMEYYEEARKEGYKFYKIDAEYNRYLLTAQELKDYQKIVDMAWEYLMEYEGWLSDENLARTYYNLALSYLNLDKKEEAKEYFFKAVELNEEYQEYAPFFENL